MDNLQTLYSDHLALQDQLADATTRHKEAKATLDQEIERVKLRWQQSNAELIAELQDISGLAALKEAELRGAVTAAYKANPASKTVATGLSVRVASKAVYDPKQAFQWALAHKLALTLDAKTFELYAKNDQSIDFVTWKDEPTAVIGKRGNDVASIN